MICFVRRKKNPTNNRVNRFSGKSITSLRVRNLPDRGHLNTPRHIHSSVATISFLTLCLSGAQLSLKREKPLAHMEAVSCYTEMMPQAWGTSKISLIVSFMVFTHWLVEGKLWIKENLCHALLFLGHLVLCYKFPISFALRKELQMLN